MEEINTIEPIALEEFLPQVLQMKIGGWRVAQICASAPSEQPGRFELSYSFAREYELRTLRLTVEGDTPVPSITELYPGAFIQENEVAELFGVNIEHIGQDYRRRLYRIAEEAPFAEK